MTKRKANTERNGQSYDNIKLIKMTSEKDTNCPTCGERAHNFANEEALNCIPPITTLTFGENQLDKNYRQALFQSFPSYTSEEIVGSYLGRNPYFLSQAAWLDGQEEER